MKWHISMGMLHVSITSCAMFGLNQAECCSGESVEFCAGTQQNEIALSPQRLQ